MWRKVRSQKNYADWFFVSSRLLCCFLSVQRTILSIKNMRKMRFLILLCLVLFHALLSSFHRCQKIIININSLSNLSSTLRSIFLASPKRQQPATRKKRHKKLYELIERNFCMFYAPFYLFLQSLSIVKFVFCSLFLSAYLRCILISQLTTKAEFMLLLCVCCFWTHWNFFFLVRALQSSSSSHIHFSLRSSEHTNFTTRAYPNSFSVWGEMAESSCLHPKSPSMWGEKFSCNVAFFEFQNKRKGQRAS